MKHIYKCITRRLEQLEIDRKVRVQDWQNLQNSVPEQLNIKIHIDDFTSINIINLPEHLSESLEFSLESLRSVAQTLLQIGQLEETELGICLNVYLAVTNPEVARIALGMVESKYPEVFERLN